MTEEVKENKPEEVFFKMKGETVNLILNALISVSPSMIKDMRHDAQIRGSLVAIQNLEKL